MMRRYTKRRSSKSGLFLMELIIAILFFALTSAICIQLFVHAHLISEESSYLNTAVLKAQSAAAYFKNAGGSQEALQALLGAERLDATQLAVPYDKDWQPVAPGGFTAFTLYLRLDGQNPETAEIRVAKAGETQESIYTLRVLNYHPADRKETP